MEPPLPQVAAAPVEAVDILRVAKVGRADGPGQRPLLVGNRDQMDMVGHQAVSEDLQAILLGLLLQKPQVHPPVLVHEEHGLAVISVLRDVMGIPHGYRSGYSGHAANLPSGATPRQARNGSCPSYSHAASNR